MTFWTLLEWLAWLASAGIALYMVTDLVRVSRQHSEEVLTNPLELLDTSVSEPRKD